ncbi:MAG: thiamine ABC transporter substrate-binding protein [Ilumatobacteraceae bacterium]|nr:thiamine ABC transporter substrate-binding protein [Ilumatobacteraceae bacterium]
MKFLRSLLATSFVLVVTACSSQSSNTSTDATPNEVILLAYDAFTPQEGIFDAFTAATGAKVKVVTSGDTGTLISKAILTAGNPEGDVLWGLDNTLLSRAQKAELLTSYEPVDYGDICVNYDKQWFASRNIAPPTSLEDLALPTYKNLLTVEDPVASSPGLGFLLGTIAHFGADNWQGYWKSLKANGVHIAPDWTTAYTIDFSGSSGKGKYPLVVSYGSSPPAEVLYAEKPIDTPPTAVIESTCFRQTEYVGALRGTRNPNNATLLISYLLDVPFQESMPLSLFVFPINKKATLPDLFTQFAVTPKNPLSLNPADIEKNRDSWLSTWRDIVL